MKAYVLILSSLLAVCALLALPRGRYGEIRAGRSRAVEEAVEDLSAGSHDARERATRRLASLGAAARPSILGALEHPSSEVRLRAASALRLLARAEEDPVVRRKREYLRIVRIGLLVTGGLGPNTSLFAALTLSPDLAAEIAVEQARAGAHDLVLERRAVLLLRDLGSAVGAEYLSELFARENTLPSTLHLAGEGLARCGGPREREQLRRAFSSRNPLLRSVALRTLAHIGEATDLEVARCGARDASPRVRREAPAVLLALGGEGARRDLDALLGDPDHQVRASALRALGSLNGSAGLDAARKALEDVEPEVRVAALSVFRRRGVLETAILRKGLADTDRSVRRAALFSVRHLPPEERRKALEGMLEEEDSFLREFRRSLTSRGG